MKVNLENFSGFHTPIYVLEESRLRKNLELIKSVADRADVEIILAFKAYALWKTFPIFREYISSTTASSLSEARLAFEEFGSKAHTFSPAYTDEEIDEIARCSSHLTFNSLSQYARYYERVKKNCPDIQLGLRVNPEYSEVAPCCIIHVHRALDLESLPTSCQTSCHPISRDSIVIAIARVGQMCLNELWCILRRSSPNGFLS